MPASTRALSDFLCSFFPSPSLLRVSSRGFEMATTATPCSDMPRRKEEQCWEKVVVFLSGGRIFPGCLLILVVSAENGKELEGNQDWL